MHARIIMKIAASALILCAPAARAIDLHPEIGAGITHYTPYSDGIWYQLGNRHYLDLHAKAFLVGITGDLLDRHSWGATWHADFVDFGRAASSCVCTPLDSNYDTRVHRMRLNAVPVPDATFNGHGRVRGLVFKVAVWKEWHGIRFGVEAGITPYRQTWHETVSHWTPSLQMAPRTVSLDASRKWAVVRMVGLSVSRGHYTVAFDHYAMPSYTHYGLVPPIWNDADVLSISYAF